MQENPRQGLTPSLPPPGSWRDSKDVARASPRATRDPPDTSAAWEELLGEELAALYADLPRSEGKTEPGPILGDEHASEVDKELAALLEDTSPPQQDDESMPDAAGEPPSKKPTFAPSTKMQAGKVQWQARFSALPHALLVHENFAALSGRAAKLLLAMLSQYKGSNNGHLTATASRMREFGFNSKDSLAKSIQELLVFGFIVRTRSQQKRLPARYALTWLPIHKALTGEPYDRGIEPGDEALDLWRSIDPRKAKGKLAALKNSTASPHDAKTLH